MRRTNTFMLNLRPANAFASLPRRTNAFAPVLHVMLLFCASLLFQSCGGGQTNTGSAPIDAAPPATPVRAQPTPTATQQQQIVSASAEATTLAAGGAGEAAVRLNIANGFHVNANPATDKFLIATELRAEAQEGITPGKAVYPRAVTKSFQFSDKPLAVYEGQPVVKLPLRADKTATKGNHNFRATLRVQPCNDQECLQPRNVEVSIPVTIN